MKKLRAIYRLITTKEYFLVTVGKHDLFATVQLSEENRVEVEDFMDDIIQDSPDECRQALLN